MAQPAAFWTEPAQDLFTALESTAAGLTEAEASRRRKQYGSNKLADSEAHSAFRIFLSQFRNPLVWVLAGASFVSFLLGDAIDAVVILSILLLTALLGFYQEFKAEKALRELKKYLTIHTKVWRDGNLVERDATDLVPGDVIQLNIGDMIPADLRLLEVSNLSCNESALTGESLPVEKQASPILVLPTAGEAQPQQLTNCAFMGTFVASGTARGMVTTTGAATFFGKTAAYLQQPAQLSDFERNLNQFGKFLLRVVIVMSLFVFGTNVFLDKPLLESFMFAVALAVGITPEVLPIIMTVTLSRGALSMAREKVVTKRLSSVEDLGNMTLLCSDKTGTLTEGTLTLQGFFNADGEADDQVLLLGMLSSATDWHSSTKQFTNPIDKAIWQSPEAASLNQQLFQYRLIRFQEFDFERKRTSALVASGSDSLLVVKGAFESVMAICNSIYQRGETVPLSDQIKSTIQRQIANYEAQGYHLIAVAEKKLGLSPTKVTESALTLKGFLLFLDPPKPGVKEVLDKLAALGVGLKILSGDSRVICEKICAEVGITITEGKVITGEVLQGLDESAFREYSYRYNVFARVTPEQKFRIVSYLNREDTVVGYLGDGINDAPALKAADVGITVSSAAAIAKEAADIILLEKDLRVLAHGILTGRKTFGNITKYILSTISANYGNMFTVAISSLFLPFIPLLSSQILLNNFLSDVPMLSISTDNVDKEYSRQPKQWDQKLIFRFMLFFGLLSTLFDLVFIIPLVVLLHTPAPVFRTAWFLESALSELIIVFAVRTRLPFYRSRPSRWLMLSSGVVLVLTLLLPYTAWGADYFQFKPLSGSILGFMTLVLLVYFVSVEAAKHFFYQQHHSHSD